MGPKKDREKQQKKSAEKQVAASSTGPSTKVTVENPYKKEPGKVSNMSNVYAKLLTGMVGSSTVSPIKGSSGFRPQAYGIQVKNESIQEIEDAKQGFYSIKVAVIPGEALMFWVEHGQLNYSLANIVWKLLPSKRHLLKPDELETAQALEDAGVSPRCYKLMEFCTTAGGSYSEKQKKYRRGQYETAVNVFHIAIEPDCDMNQDKLFKFFTDFCKQVLDKTPVAIQKKVITRPYYDSFLVNGNATYAEIIGREQAQIRFKWEVGEPSQIGPMDTWFSDNRDMLFKYFRPGKWWPELAAFHAVPNPEEVLSEKDYRELVEMELLPEVEPSDQTGSEPATTKNFD